MRPLFLRLKYLKDWPENKGKHHCTSDLLFVLIGLDGFAYAQLVTYLLVWLNPNQSNRRSAVHWHFPLRSKWVFSGLAVGVGWSEKTFLPFPCLWLRSRATTLRPRSEFHQIFIQNFLSLPAQDQRQSFLTYAPNMASFLFIFVFFSTQWQNLNKKASVVC